MYVVRVIMLTKVLGDTNILDTLNESKSIDIYNSLLCRVVLRRKSTLTKVILGISNVIYVPISMELVESN